MRHSLLLDNVFSRHKSRFPCVIAVIWIGDMGTRGYTYEHIWYFDFITSSLLYIQKSLCNSSLLHPSSSFIVIHHHWSSYYLLLSHFLHTDAFAQRCLHTEELLHTTSFSRRNFYTQKLLHREAFTQRSFHTTSFPHRSFYTQMPLQRSFSTEKPLQSFTQRSFYTQKLFHGEVFAPNRSFSSKDILHREVCTQKTLYAWKPLHEKDVTQRNFETQTLLHTEIYTQRSFDTQKLHTEKILRRGAFNRRSYTQKLWHTQKKTSFCTQTLLHREAFTQRSFYTHPRLQTEAFPHRSFYTETSLHKGAFTHIRVYTQNLLPTEVFNTAAFKSLHREAFTTAAFTQRSFHTQKPVHREAFTQRSFTHDLVPTQKLLHTDAFTEKLFHREAFTILYTEELLHTETSPQRSLCREELLQTEVFLTFISGEGVASEISTSQFCRSFWCSTLIATRRRWTQKIRISPHTFMRWTRRSLQRAATPVRPTHRTRTISAEGRVLTPKRIRISPHIRASDTHDLRRGSRFDGHGRAAPAAKRENLEELEEQKFCRSSDARRSPGSKLVCSNSCITTPV